MLVVIITNRIITVAHHYRKLFRLSDIPTIRIIFTSIFLKEWKYGDGSIMVCNSDSSVWEILLKIKWSLHIKKKHLPRKCVSSLEPFYTPYCTIHIKTIKNFLRGYVAFTLHPKLFPMNRLIWGYQKCHYPYLNIITTKNETNAAKMGPSVKQINFSWWYKNPVV